MPTMSFICTGRVISVAEFGSNVKCPGEIWNGVGGYGRVFPPLKVNNNPCRKNQAHASNDQYYRKINYGKDELNFI